MERFKLKKTKRTYLKVKDHSVSGEEFELVYNSDLAMLETCPKPSQEDLPKYYESEDYISHTGSKRNLFEKAYHIVRSISLKRKLRIINECVSEQDQNYRPARTLLDIGCGTGDFLQKAQSDYWTVSGIEPDEKARAIANKKTNNAVHGLNQLHVFEKHSFDVITLWHVLEHLPNLNDQITLFKSLLNKNGTLIIAVPNHKSFDAKFYKEFWAAYDVPRHLWHFSQASISRLFAKENMTVKKIVPMKFDAYYVSLLSEKYKSGWMNFLRALPIGFTSNLKARFSSEYSSLIYIIKNS